MNVVMPSLRHTSFRPSRVHLKFAFTSYRPIGLLESFSAGAHRNGNVQCYWNLVRFLLTTRETCLILCVLVRCSELFGFDGSKCEPLY